MKLNYDKKKPSIHIYYNKNLNNRSRLKEILWGIEEEEIPYRIQEKEGTDATKLAYEACEKSVLGVGIGIDWENIVLHYVKLKKDKPLYEVSTNSSALFTRILGANAARLVKRIPFKTLKDHGSEKNAYASEKDLEEEVKDIVERVIARIKLG